MSPPIIGILLDYDTRKKDQGGYANYPWYALRCQYSRAIKLAGGIPILLPYETNLIKSYIEFCSGIMLPGGIDIHPSYYGERIKVKNIKIFPDNFRIEFEIKLIRAAIKAKLPLLAICGGYQALNVALGGSLYQDIEELLKTNINHSKENHTIQIQPKTKLHSIAGLLKCKVNSFHHQSVKKLGKCLITNAVAPDGIIEGIEHSKLPFCIGVEWHPEYLESKEDIKLFKAFVKAAKHYNDS